MTVTPTTNYGPWWKRMVIHWHSSELMITFHSPLSISERPETLISSLHLDELNQFLNLRGYNLRVHAQNSTTDTPGTSSADWMQSSSNDLGLPDRKFFFTSSGDQGTFANCVFALEPSFNYMSAGVSQATLASYSGNDLTREVVSLLNRSLGYLNQQAQIPIVAAMPNWLSMGSPMECASHGGSIVPPIPVEGASIAEPAQWKMQLPDLSPTLQQLEGKDVTVLVLDTVPTPNAISLAADRAGQSNPVLKQIAAGLGKPDARIKVNYQELPDILEEGSNAKPVSGFDLYGRLVCYEMSDHGLFVASILQQVVPQAKIECIRVLNDYGVGNIEVLIDALQAIHTRLMLNGDLYNQNVVVNLSLVITPAHDECVSAWYGNAGSYSSTDLAAMIREMELLRAGLHCAIQSLTDLGAVVVAAAGNDSTVQQWSPSTYYEMSQRNGPRYPAAFPEVISVGAVDKENRAAPYSNYPAVVPQRAGIATYGGGLPTPVAPKTPADRTQATNIDALQGVYTAATYPALSAQDSSLTYDDPNPYGWAYWSGTSFATPIVSGLAARVLEKIRGNGRTPQQLGNEVRWAITTASGQQAIITEKGSLPFQSELGVSLLRAEQPALIVKEETSKAGV